MPMIMRSLIAIMVCIFVSPLGAGAAAFDGSSPLICAFSSAVECSPSGGCTKVEVEDMRLPVFVNIDFDAGTIRGRVENGRTTAIENVEHIDGKLILQGAEDGNEGDRDGTGWTVSISEDSGKMAAVAVGDQIAFILFGACTPQ